MHRRNKVQTRQVDFAPPPKNKYEFLENSDGDKKGKVIPELQLITTPWRRTGGVDI